MLLSDIQYGRLQLIELSAGHSDQCGNQRWVTAGYTQYQECCETLYKCKYIKFRCVKITPLRNIDGNESNLS
jgi:hypothetical protein